MKRCPITYQIIPVEKNYSEAGLHLLSPKLKDLHPLNLNADEQRKEALARVGKMSIQGVQLKLSAKLNIQEGCFELVDEQGYFILKPQSEYYPELPENEALTMSLAAMMGLEVPVHGLLYSKDNSMTYFIKRFDRITHHKKLAIEDFAQLSHAERDTKYNSSMEKIISIINQFCTYPKIELVKLFQLTLFNFLMGNEDMHLKNFSLMTRDNKVLLSPAYDLLNSTIAQKNTKEELALPLNGKKNNLQQRDFFEYFAIERLDLNQSVIADVIGKIARTIPRWKKLIHESFLSKDMQDKYTDLLNHRCERLNLKAI